VIDRGGVPRTTPLIGLCFAVVRQQPGRYSHVGELARAAAEIKGYLKQKGGGDYLVDRRGRLPAQETPVLPPRSAVPTQALSAPAVSPRMK
jgi:hypothetical protein